MKTVKLNPTATELEIELRASIEDMERQGWEFDDFHRGTADIFQIDLDEAKKMNYENYEFVLEINGTPEKPEFLYCWYNAEMNEYTEPQQTGDDEATWDDVQEMLSSGDMRIVHDNSIELNRNYIKGIVKI